ncbi:MAG: hypothetical protein LBF67_09630 [Prevotellaceae bacterium]|jgi:hypothetical protein|nr:hypothetical protein [Prevotellaceae bacterium]
MKMETGIEKIRNKVIEIGACADFKKPLRRAKTLQEMAALFFTPQGIEHCVKYGTPSLEDVRALDKQQLAEQGVYVDEKILLHNPKRVALFGTAVADLSYSDTGARHEVILMHGAQAHIKASGYAVVFVTNAGGTISSEVYGHAKIL